jgi:hypothetical protein
LYKIELKTNLYKLTINTILVYSYYIFINIDLRGKRPIVIETPEEILLNIDEFINNLPVVPLIIRYHIISEVSHQINVSVPSEFKS